jgi:mRNA interferase HicA
MKRRELLRHLNSHGCALLREGANHSWWLNPLVCIRSLMFEETLKQTRSVCLRDF